MIFNLFSKKPKLKALQCCALVVITLACARASVAEDGYVTNKRVAILSSVQLRAAGLSDLLMVQLQELEVIELVERDMLDEVIGEIELGELFGASQTSSRKMAGRMLGADMLILLSFERIDEKEHIRYVVCDCPTGARLRFGCIAWQQDKIEDAVVMLKTTIANTLAHHRHGVKQIIAVGGFVSRNLVHDYDHFQAGYASLLAASLGSAPGVAALETEEARAIRNEIELTGRAIAERLIPVFVEGEFVVSGNGAGRQQEVDIGIDISDNSGLMNHLDFDNVPIAKVGHMISKEIAGSILAASGAESTAPLGTERQFEMLVERADEFASIGAWDHSVGLREAAVLLKPDSAKQRGMLIIEYPRKRNLLMPVGAYLKINELAPHEQWKVCFEHLEYLISNGLISIKLANESVAWLFDQFYTIDDGYRRDFLRNVYTKALELDASVPGDKHYERIERQQWYRIMVDHLEPRRKTWAPNKQDVELWLDMHEDIVPEDVIQPDKLMMFLRHYSLPQNFREYPHAEDGQEYADEPDFLAFLEILSKSPKVANAFCGRFLLLRFEYLEAEYYKDRSYGDLSERCAQLAGDIEKLRKSDPSERYYDEDSFLVREIRSLIQLTAPKPKEAAEEQKVVRRPVQRRRWPGGYRPPKVSRGNVIFKKIPVEVRDRSGDILPAYEKTWDQSNSRVRCGMRRAVRCGKKLDVMWSDGAVLYMKEKGILDEVLIADREADLCFEDVVWDGRHVWVSTLKQGIWVLNTEGQIITKVHSEEGLPPAEGGLRLYALEEGKVIAVGSFGRFGRGWCAVVEHEGATPCVTVFHNATKLPNGIEGDAPPDVAFAPLGIYEYNGSSQEDKLLFILRRIKGTPHPCPLIIDADKLSADIYVNGSTLNFSASIQSDWGMYLSRNGILLEAGHRIRCYAAPGEYLPTTGFPKAKDILSYRNHAGCIIEYRGEIYVPGYVWHRLDIEKIEKEAMIEGELPEPYRSLGNFWDSAHYGLVGWNWNSGFYQITFTEDEQCVYGRYHYMSFLDDEGRVKRYDLEDIVVELFIDGYKAAVYNHENHFWSEQRHEGWFVPGIYKARLERSNGETLDFEPLKIRSDSPEELQFKLED